MKPELTKAESELYLKIVQHGTMDDMFDIGYAIGRATLAKEQLERLTNDGKTYSCRACELGENFGHTCEKATPST